MNELVRFGVSIEPSLLEQFDEIVEKRGYPTRSEALRDMIRDALIKEKISIQDNSEVLGSLTLIYDHHAGKLLQQMNDIQHEQHDIILSVMHMHVSHDDCMEIIALRGKASDIAGLANKLISLKGIKNGKLFLTLPSSDIA